MAQMIPQKHEITEFNGETGDEYGLQISDASDFTKVVENATYSAKVADSLVNSGVDNTEANNVGTAQVEITGTGTAKKFKFLNLKGQTGNGITSVSKTGTSGLTDTYTIAFNDSTSTTFTVTNGEKGDKGDTGLTPNITIGTTTTLETGQPATVTITGTTDNPTLNLGLPKGNTGSQGIQGKSYNPKGEWVSGTSYINNSTIVDVVYYDGDSYYCKLSNSSTTNPLEDTTNWGLLTSGNATNLVKSINVAEIITFTSGSISSFNPSENLKQIMSYGAILDIDWDYVYTSENYTYTNKFVGLGEKFLTDGTRLALNYVKVEQLYIPTNNTSRFYNFVIDATNLTGGTITLNKIRYLSTNLKSNYEFISEGGGGVS